MMRLTRLWKTFFFILALILIFFVIAFNYESQSMIGFDQKIGDWVRGWASDPMTAIFILITLFGNTNTYVILMIVLGGYLIIRLRRVRETLVLLINLIGIWQLNELLKRLFERSRPALEHLIEAKGYSFPSGHAMVSVAFYGMVVFLFWTCFWKTPRSLRSVGALAAWLVLMIGLSRIYLGVHYPSDIIAGYVLGGAWLILCIAAYRYAARAK